MLTVPDLSEKTDAAVETRPSKTEKWLESLPFVNKFETSRQLYVALMGLNRLMLDDKTRFKLLELYREPIKRLSEELTQASHKVAEAMYQQASQAGEQQAGPGAAGAGPEQPEAAAPDDDVVDADFEEVKDDKK